MSTASKSAAPQASEPYVLRRDHDGIATLTMNRGDQMNQLSTAMIGALQAELDGIAADDSVRVVVLAGAGKQFCAGHDLREMRAHPDKEWQSALFARCQRMLMTLIALPQPVIARVHGAAVAAGCELVSICDLAVATDGARFALPGIKNGIFCTTPAVGVGRNLARKHALEMVLTGDLVDAATALSWGLVNRVVPAERLDDEVEALARKIASYSQAVIAMGKRLFYQQIEKGLAEAYPLAGECMASNMMLEDAAEGIDAFLEKRPPKWRGK
jgi:enoyl-CoA hydratase/carnithine racemase